MKKLTRLLCISIIIFMVIVTNVNAQQQPEPTNTPNVVPTIDTSQSGGTTPATDAGIAYSVDQIKKLLKNIADWLSNPWDNPEEPPSEAGECTECPEDGFEKRNFLEYAKGKFEDKFPFDAIGGVGGGGGGECMSLNGQQECQLKEGLGNFLEVVKFPIWIAFLISLIRMV